MIAIALGVALKRKWLILGILAATLILTLIATLLMTPQYTAKATLEIRRETQNFTRVAGADAADAAMLDPEFYETQYGLLRSHSLAERVATDLRLYDNRAFFTMFGSNKVDTWFDESRVLPSVSTRATRVSEAADILLKRFGLDSPRLSRIVNISFTSPDPAFSKQVVDAWGKHFIQATLTRRYETTTYARNFLEGRLTQLRARIDESERLLVSYAAQEGIVNLPVESRQGNETTRSERALVYDDLEALNKELSSATADRVRAETRLGAKGSQVSEALQDQAISQLRSERGELTGQYAKLLEQFEPDYPPARALARQISELDRTIAGEERRVRQVLEQTYQASRGRESELQQRVEGLKSSVLDVRRRSIQYNIYQREVDTNRQLYDALLQRYKEIGVAGGVGVNNISVVDQAELPDRPSRPRFLLNMLFGILLGVVLGAGTAFVLEQLDEGISDPTMIPGQIGMSLLGTVPNVEGEPLEALRDAKSSLSEAYFSLRTNLALATDHGFPRTLAVTSSRPAEGKSITVQALARTLAGLSNRVVIIDCDMRSPSVHHLLALPNTAGMSNILSGSDDLESFVQLTEIENLFAVSAGPQPPNAAELLASDRVARTLSRFQEMFDYVVIDSPPVMGLADALLIGRQVEQTIFVVAAHSTGKGVVRVALSRLQAAGVRLSGIVLTRFNSKRAHFGYGYDYGYGYGYGTDAKA